MPRVKPGHRKRAYAPKERYGCRTCKARRVKCGEQRPACIQCQSTGRVCDGYEFVRPTDPESFSQDLTRVIPSSPFSGSADELRAFTFYQEWTCDQLAGYRDEEFWKKLVPQMAQTDDGVRHALVALASVHKQFGEGELYGQIDNKFGIKHYNMAIRRHLNSISKLKPDPDRALSYLIPCAMFICIEMLQSDQQFALSLVDKAIHILNHFINSNKEREMPFMTELRVFERFFHWVEAQAMELGKTNNISYIPQLSTIDPTMPAEFTSISEAQEYLQFYVRMYRVASTRAASSPSAKKITPAAVTAFVQPFQDRMEEWTSAFQAFLFRNRDSLNKNESYAVEILQMHRLMNSSSLEAASQMKSVHDEMVWDSYNLVFENVVSIAESIFALFPDLCQVWRPGFSLEIGIVGPLYDAARRCRDPLIRRRAIKVLWSYPRREGIWDGILAARICERVVAIEEKGREVSSSADIAEYQRIFDVTPASSQKERWCELHYSRMSGPDSHEIEHHKEIIRW